MNLSRGSIWVQHISLALKNLVYKLDPSIDFSLTYPDVQVEFKESKMCFLQFLNSVEDKTRQNNEDTIESSFTEDNKYQIIEYVAIPYKLMFQMDLVFKTKLELDNFVMKLQGNIPKFSSLDVTDSKNNKTKTFMECLESRFIPSEKKEFRYVITLVVCGILDEREPFKEITVQDIIIKQEV